MQAVLLISSIVAGAVALTTLWSWRRKRASKIEIELDEYRLEMDDPLKDGRQRIDEWFRRKGYDGFSAGRSLPEPEDRLTAGRYANLRLEDANDGSSIPYDLPLRPGARLTLWLGIGSMDPRSLVRTPIPVPEHLLPDNDVELDVVVASADFLVGIERPDGMRATGRLILPARGAPARTPDGGTELAFVLQAPTVPRRARVRVGYYFRDALVQSQVIEAAIGVAGGIAASTDFTTSVDLTDLVAIPERPRLSVLLNDSMPGLHQVLVRAPSDTGRSAREGDALSFDLAHDQLSHPLRQLRDYLESEHGRPTKRLRRKSDLVRDLQNLADAGAALYDKLLAQARSVLLSLVRSEGDVVVSVSRPSTSTFTVPWAFLYEPPLPESPRADRWPVCELIRGWDGSSPLVPPGSRRCPHAHDPGHNGVLCPFGFWGFRYATELLTSSERVITEVPLGGNAKLVAPFTRERVKDAEVQNHLDALLRTIQRLSPSQQLAPAGTIEEAKRELGADIPLVYFYCHGKSVDNQTVLSIGRGEPLPSRSFQNWVKTWWEAEQYYWGRIRPLVFINACHSVELLPTTLISYVEAFVGTGGAAGVIGTEATVHADLAMEAASVFFTKLTTQRPDGRTSTAAEAMHALRLHFLAAGNLFGLVYTPYCWADLRLSASE